MVTIPLSSGAVILNPRWQGAVVFRCGAIMESVSSESSVLLSNVPPPSNFPSSLHTTVTPNNGTSILLLTMKGYENGLLGSCGVPTSMVRTWANAIRPEREAHISMVTDIHFTARLRDEGGWFVMVGGVRSPAGIFFFFFGMAGIAG